MPVKPENSDGKTIQMRPAMIWPDGSVAVKDAAVLFGVSGQSILNWIKSGAPHVPGAQGRSNPTRVNVREIAKWQTEQALDARGDDGDRAYNEGRAKAMDWHYRAIKRRAEASKELGTLVPVDIVADLWEKEHTTVRTQLLTIADRLAVTLAAETDPITVRTRIGDEIALAMSELSGVDVAITSVGGDPSLSFYDQIDLDDDMPDDADEPEGSDDDDGDDL